MRTLENYAKLIADDQWLQAISIAVAVVTAVYYLFRAMLWCGQGIWKFLSPSLNTYMEQRLNASKERVRLASTDSIFLIAEAGRLLIVVLIFLVLYFMILVPSEVASGGVYAEVDQLTRLSRNIFIAAAAYNLSRIHRWFVDIAKERRLQLEAQS